MENGHPNNSSMGSEHASSVFAAYYPLRTRIATTHAIISASDPVCGILPQVMFVKRCDGTCSVGSGCHRFSHLNVLLPYASNAICTSLAEGLTHTIAYSVIF